MEVSMRRADMVRKLIAKNDRDITLFQEYLGKLRGKPGVTQVMGDLRRRIAAAKWSNDILQNAA
jgi:hypothetical protein